MSSPHADEVTAGRLETPLYGLYGSPSIYDIFDQPRPVPAFVSPGRSTSTSSIYSRLFTATMDS